MHLCAVTFALRFPGATWLYSFTSGFFVWDMIIVVIEGWGFGFFAHALSCLCVFSGSLVRGPPPPLLQRRRRRRRRRV
jgi:hypothetical protein